MICSSVKRLFLIRLLLRWGRLYIKSREPAGGRSGSLIYTGARFAQLLEGPGSSVDEIMASIQKDKRHDQITLLPVPQRSVRRFGKWTMAYAGRSLYVDRHVKRHFQHLRGEEQVEECERLIELMWALNQSMPVPSIS
ncbi:BLUF domain-containing protein [Sphingobium herbicidovorans]